MPIPVIMTALLKKTCQIGLVGIFLLMVVTTTVAEEDNEWVVSRSANESFLNEPIKLCSDDGSKIIFSNVSVSRTGYSECGKLSYVALCDAEGRKYVGPRDRAPYGYLDCSLGPRIQITRHDPLPDYSAYESGLDSHQKPEHDSSAGILDDYKDYLSTLDGLFDDGSSQKQNRRGKKVPGESSFGQLGDIQGMLGPLLQQLQELSSDN